MSNKMGKDNKIYNETKVIYDDDDYMVVKPLTPESILYFTDGNKDYVKFVERSNDEWDLYLVIDKKHTPNRFYGIENDDGKIEIYYYDGKDKDEEYEDKFEKMGMLYFNDAVPYEVRDSLNPFVYEGTTYGILNDIKNGKDFSLDDLMDSSDIINKIRYNEKRPGKSMVSLIFDDAEEYFTSLGMDEDSLYTIINLFDSPYYDMEIVNYDQTYEDWREGYLITTFNEKNNKLLHEILTYISPELLSKTFQRGDEWNRRVSILLIDMFEKEMDWIITDYTDLENGCRVKELMSDIKEDSCDKLGEYGIFMGECFSRYFTTVGILIRLYDNSNDKSQSLSSLFGELLDGEDINYDDWIYESYCSDDYDDDLNIQIKTSLESIIEKIEESDEFIDIAQFSYLYNKYVDKYGFKEYHKNPISGDFFRIEGVNKKNNKIIVGVGKDKPNNFQSREYDEEGFNLFLNQPELF